MQPNVKSAIMVIGYNQSQTQTAPKHLNCLAKFYRLYTRQGYQINKISVIPYITCSHTFRALWTYHAHSLDYLDMTI